MEDTLVGAGDWLSSRPVSWVGDNGPFGMTKSEEKRLLKINAQ
jgi:hypothetical protein